MQARQRKPRKVLDPLQNPTERTELHDDEFAKLQALLQKLIATRTAYAEVTISGAPQYLHSILAHCLIPDSAYIAWNLPSCVPALAVQACLPEHGCERSAEQCTYEGCAEQGQSYMDYEDPEDAAERARLQQASHTAKIGQLDAARLEQLLALTQLLLKDVGRPDMDLTGLDLAAQQALIGIQVMNCDRYDASLTVKTKDRAAALYRTSLTG